MVTDENDHGERNRGGRGRGKTRMVVLSLVEMMGQVLHTDPRKAWSLVGLCQGAHPSLWAEGPVGRTFQQPPFYRPHWIAQGYQALQLLRAQETGEGPQPEKGTKLAFSGHGSWH